MMKYQANLWNDALRGSTLLDCLPWSPLRSYNIWAMGLEWDKMEYHDSVVGRGIPPEGVIEDRATHVSQSASQYMIKSVKQVRSQV